MERGRKRELRALNLRVWAGEQDVFLVQASLDSKLQKNTAFIRRLRTGITAASVATVHHEVASLSLQKYLSEIISASYEGLCKLKTPGDVAAGVEVMSDLHQRFGPDEFTKYLGWMVGRGLSMPEKSQLKGLAPDVREKEEKERLARHRVLIRVATELWLAGVLRSLEDVSPPEDAVKGKDTGGKTGTTGSKVKPSAAATGGDPEPFPLEVLKELLGHDREHLNLPLLVLFVKTFSWEVLGLRTTKGPNEQPGRRRSMGSTEDESSEVDEQEHEQEGCMVDAKMQQRFKAIITRYIEDVRERIVRDHKRLISQSQRNEDAYVRSGEIFEDRQSNFEKQQRTQERLIENAQSIADILGLEMPDLEEKSSTTFDGGSGIGLVKTAEYLRGQEGAGIWEDVEERRFYESLTDLKDRFPKMFEEVKKKPENDEQVGKRKETEPLTSPVSSTTPTSAKPAEDGEDKSTVIENKTVGAQVDELLARLPELTNKEKVDEVAVDFCLLNSKASRNRMIRALQELPRTRSDLLPFYGRLVATLGRYMTDISTGLVSYLDDEFRSLQKRKSKDFLGQVRMMNVRYLAELTKFGVVPDHKIFHCLKVCLDDFGRMNIEIIATLLENCGRYLLRNPETAPRMTQFLEIVQRLKSARPLDVQERMMVENALYYVNPPELASIRQKERTPTDLYVRKLIYDLSKRDLDRASVQVRKLHWEEPEITTLLLKIFTKPHKMKYSNIHFLADVLESLRRYHPEFTATVIDDLLENITFSLELNDFKFNQRRLAEVKYLGELYVYKLVDSQVIFDTLYKIISYGHEGGIPKPGYVNTLDPPEDFFRVRLACHLLETCGVYYDKGASKRKLDFFLSFFQYYIRTKAPLPMETDFLIQDTFALLRPQLKLPATLDEASAAFAEAVRQNYDNAANGKMPEPDDVGDDSASDDGGEAGGRPARGGADSGEGSSDEMAGNDDLPTSPRSDSEEEHIVVTLPGAERDPEVEADFEREYAKMMTETAESRKSERRPAFDLPLPMRRAPPSAGAGPTTPGMQQTIMTGEERESDDEDPSASNPAPAEDPKVMRFALLSRKGNRQQTRAIDLPSDSSLAIAMRTQQRAERAEQQRIKNLVLSYDQREGGGGDDPDGLENSRPGHAHHHPTTTFERPSKKKAQGPRKLQLSDVNWT